MFFIDILQQQIVSKICLLSNRKFNLITPLITDCEKTKMLDECYILKPLILDLARALDSCKIIDFVYFKGNNTVYFEDGKTNVCIAIRDVIINGTPIEPGSIFVYTNDLVCDNGEFIVCVLEELWV